MKDEPQPELRFPGVAWLLVERGTGGETIRSERYPDRTTAVQAAWVVAARTGHTVLVRRLFASILEGDDEVLVVPER